MAFKLATAFVAIQAKDQLGPGLEKSKKGLLSGLGGAVKIGIAGLVAGLGAASVKMVKLGSDAEELQSMFDTVFGASAKDAQDFAESMARDIGRSSGDLMESMAGFQDLFVPLGFARDEAAGLSKQMVKLTQDVGSFKNEDPASVAQAFNSALVGQGRAVLKYGVILNKTTLDAELMRMGIAKGSKAATEQQKVQARLNIIMAATADAHGDAEKTAGSFANRMLGLKGAIKDVAGDIGGAFLPMLANMAGGLTNFVRNFQDTLKPMLTWIKVIGENWGLTWGIIVDSAAIQVQRLIDVWNQFPDVLGSVMDNAKARFINASKSMIDGAAEVYAPFFVGMQKGWDQLFENMMAAQQDREPMDLSGDKNRLENFECEVDSLKDTLGVGKNVDVPDILGLQASEASKILEQDLATKMDQLVTKFDEAVNPAKAFEPKKGGGGGGTSKLKVDKLELPSGFMNFESANQNLQDALLKQNKDAEMVGLMQQGNQQGQTLNGLVQKLVAKPPVQAAPVAGS